MEENLELDDLVSAYEQFSDLRLSKSYQTLSLMSLRLIELCFGCNICQALALLPPLRAITQRIVFSQFCGGETLAGCARIIRHYKEHGIDVVLDYAGEGSSKLSLARDASIETSKVIDYSAAQRLDFAVFKPSSVMYKQELMLDLCQKAYNRGLSIMIDAEESWVQTKIDSFVVELMRRFNTQRCIVYTTVQLYRRSGLDDIKELYQEATAKKFFLGIKLVRGAYLEREHAYASQHKLVSPLWDSKEQTDACFDAAIDYCFARRDQIALVLGSHNLTSTQKLAKLIAREPGLARNDARFTFSQLHGMSDDLSFNLAKQGFRVVKYLPFAPLEKALPYLIRRAQENSAMLGQLSRERQRLRRGIDLRKFQ